MSARDRFDRFWELDEETGCHLWTGTTTWGYGCFWADGRTRRAHRWIMETERGPIPEGLVVDHLCRNRGCVNLDHLEVITQQENCRRRSRSDIERGCPHDHDASYISFKLYPQGLVRYCRECQRQRARARRGVDPTERFVPLRDRELCPNGHPTAEYLVVDGRGRWLCVECRRAIHAKHRETANERRRRRRAAARQHVAIELSTDRT